MAMRLHGASPTKLLRGSAAGRCRDCDLSIEWFDRHDKQRIPLTPEVPSRSVPEPFRWHVNAGIASPGTDPYAPDHCRIPHPAVCPARDHTGLPAAMAQLVGALAVRMRNRITRGEFAPVPDPAPNAGATATATADDTVRPAPALDGAVRHVLHYAQTFRLAPGRIEDVRCTAQLGDGQRCAESVFLADEGTWTQVDLPHVPGREGQSILSLGDGQMWVWSLQNAGFTTVSRWLDQRCPHHEDETLTPGHTDREWETFHPARHSAHLLTSRPHGYDAPTPATVPRPELRRRGRECADPTCTNGADWPAPEGWKCWRCAKTAGRRALTERRWRVNKRQWPRHDR